MSNSELIEIKKELREIKDFLKTIQKSSTRMDIHINFIETIYFSLKTSLDFIITNIEKFILGSEEHFIKEEA